MALFDIIYVKDFKKKNPPQTYTNPFYCTSLVAFVNSFEAPQLNDQQVALWDNGCRSILNSLRFSSSNMTFSSLQQLKLLAEKKILLKTFELSYFLKWSVLMLHFRSTYPQENKAKLLDLKSETLSKFWFFTRKRIFNIWAGQRSHTQPSPLDMLYIKSTSRHSSWLI